ncbi:MAG: response regulator [bacterium]|nr:response regulator [bacterium]
MPTSTVLVVDDNPQNVELLEAYLIPEKYNVITAFDGVEALEKVAESAPDIILLDVMMPRMNGYEVCQALKSDEKTRFIPIVMITALKELEDKIQSIEAGADDFLTKPFNKLELLTRIRSLIRVKRLHDTLEQSYIDLKELELTKDNLTQMIIHDLKNPLTGIKANLEIVGMEELKETQECLEAAQRSCDLLFNMIQDLLDISKMEEGQLNLNLETFPLSELIQALAREFEHPAKAEEKEIVPEVQSDLPPISGDRNLLYRTLSNLLINAIKHTTRKGTITVRAFQENDSARVEVADTGHGIPKDYREKIFEKFGQVESRQRSGTGLGLTFCKMAVESHGGKIWVESVEGEGSTFIFVIPFKATDA